MTFHAAPCNPGWYNRVLSALENMACALGKSEATILNPAGKHFVTVYAKADRLNRVRYYLVIGGVRHERSYLQICEQLRKAATA